MYMHMYMYMYICVCIYTHTHTHTWKQWFVRCCSGFESSFFFKAYWYELVHTHTHTHTHTHLDAVVGEVLQGIREVFEVIFVRASARDPWHAAPQVSVFVLLYY